ncbi:MAG: response regulator [Archangium sp.]|nr:response regulator [Archangium sp.]MDP3574329.1 response regulator [Archangium sp.]
MKIDSPGADSPSLTAAPLNRVLIVDDEPVTRLILGRLFSKAAIESVAVSGVAEALAQLRERRFDLLLTDKNLGVNESGVDLAVAARKLDPDLPVVMMTGFASADSADALFKLGVDDYVTKPFELLDLLERIKKARALRRLAATAPAVARRQVLVGALDPAFGARIEGVLMTLGCQPRTATSLLEGLQATPAPEVVIAMPGQLDAQVRRELFVMRVRAPALRIAVVGEPSSLEATLAAIGVSAHQRLSRNLPPADLLAALTSLVQ